ncbi:MAG TPA: hypothetical protein VED84_07935 [Acidimicrobiales bacterium]|nr:hypothetical protein [Acidimicrobiales bacterium]
MSLLIPFILWRHAWYEWANYYWLVLQQQKAVSSGFFPTYFIQTPSTGFFYPVFTFNGAPAYWLTAVLGTAFGSGWAAFLIMLGLASSASYLGMWWISRMSGLSRAWSALPALLVAMSSYTADDLYGRGDWTELIVIGFLPLLAASLISLIRRPVAPASRMACLIMATVMVLGSDNATVIALCVFAVVVAVCFLPLLPRAKVVWRGVLLATSAAAIGGCLDAWYLVPSIAYGHKIAIYQDTINFISQGVTAPFDRFVLILNPARSIIDRTTNFHPQLASLVLLWSLITVVYWMRKPELRRVAISAIGAIACCIALLSSDAIWAFLPRVVRALQFPFRMIPFAGFAVAALFIISLRAVGTRALWRATALLACSFVVALTVFQVWEAKNEGWNGHPMIVNADVTTYPFTFGGQQGGFHFPSPHPLSDPTQRIALRAAANHSFGARAHPGLAVVDVAWSPLLAASNAEILGVDSSGFAVVRAFGTNVSFRSQITPPVLVGLILTFVALVSIPVTLVVCACRRRSGPTTSAGVHHLQPGIRRA